MRFHKLNISLRMFKILVKNFVVKINLTVFVIPPVIERTLQKLCSMISRCLCNFTLMQLSVLDIK